MARTAYKANPQPQAPARAKPLPRQAHNLVGHITVVPTRDEGRVAFVARANGRVVGRGEGWGRDDLIEVAREVWGPGGVLKRSTAQGTWMVFK